MDIETSYENSVMRNSYSSVPSISSMEGGHWLKPKFDDSDSSFKKSYSDSDEKSSKSSEKGL